MEDTQYSFYFFNQEWTIVETLTDFFPDYETAQFYGKQYCQAHPELINFVIKKGPPIDIT